MSTAACDCKLPLDVIGGKNAIDYATCIAQGKQVANVHNIWTVRELLAHRHPITSCKRELWVSAVNDNFR